MPGKRSMILLVEDDPNDALLAQRALQRAGASQEILHLQDGEEAINYLSGKPPFADRTRYPLPSLVLLDLKMPRMSGFDVLTWLQGHPEFSHAPRRGANWVDRTSGYGERQKAWRRRL